MEESLQDILEKKLWYLRDLYEGKAQYDHNHNIIFKGKTMNRNCPPDEHFSCYLEHEILFKLGVDSRKLMQSDLGYIYNHLLGIVMATVYGKMSPSTAIRKIFDYLDKQKLLT